MNRPNILAAATCFARNGWSFYPTRPRSKEPFTELLPMGIMSDGRRGPVWSPYRDRQPDADEIRTWFQCAPAANLALITGPLSNLVIIEFDSLEAVAAFCVLVGIDDLVDLNTPLVQSRRGFHVYFLHPGFETTGDLGIKDCEIKGDGLSCTAPPSVHKEGHLYKFLLTPRQVEVQPLPEVVIERLQANLAAKLAPAPLPYYPHLVDSGSAYGRKALQHAADALAATTADRHRTINATAYSMGRLVGAGAMDYATAFAALEYAAQRTGYPPAECTRLVRDGLTAGLQVPKAIPQRPLPVTPRRATTLAELRGKNAFA